MSVVGLDFGNLRSVIAVARNRGIDVVCNEVSNRATPSLVSFGPKQRYLGEAAKTQEISNFHHTVGSLKRLAGRSFNDKEIQEIEKQYINAELVDEKGQIGAKVQYLGETRVFTATQLVAMYFTKLAEIASTELKIPISDVVISVPAWFTDAQRRSILDGSEIAGLNCLRLIHETTAIALGYGITKTDLPEDKPRNVVFVDVGHSSYSVAIASFVKGQLVVKATASDRNFGGRNFDQVLVDHFAEIFKEKYNTDIKSNPKALFRLRVGCERAKKVLSANSQAPLNVENVMNDIDFNSMIKREEFEELCKDLLDRIEIPLAQALEEAGLNKEDIHSIEVVGGSIRVPAIKERLSQFFGKELNFTLNQDEAVARGCAFLCAILSPVFKVREFGVQDVTSYPIKIKWETIPEVPDEESELLVFPKFNTIPSTKILTFHRKEPFDIEAYYAEPDKTPGTQSWIGRFSIKNVVPTENGDLSIVKVKARLNVHGVLSVDNATIVEEIIEEKEEPKGDEPQPMDTNQNNDEAAKVPSRNVKKVKKIVKKAELPVVAGTPSLDKSIITLYREQEVQMIAINKLVADTEIQKNALEEYVYDTRSKLDSSYAQYVDSGEKENFLNLLNETENWLYDEGDDATKSIYAGKLSSLREHGNPIANRYREAEERPKAEKQLRDSIQSFILSATSNEEKFAHISDQEKQNVVEKATQVLSWLDEKIFAQNQLPKYKDPIVLAHGISKEREGLVQYCSPIILRPKPKPEPKPEPKPAETPATPAPETPVGGSQGTPQETAATPQPETPVTQNDDRKDMDVD
ncbi:hypothetical protein G9A89_008673 [Geosiphon pyriformis]|nr:hypothetical protein G9A89_008673 [Geosiphon pyriformis]